MAKQPAWVQPMLATLTKDHFSDPGWVYEPKLDGIRCLAFKRGSDVRLMSRNKLDRTASYPKVASALAAHDIDFIVDGEIAALEGDRTSFSLLQQSHRVGGRACPRARSVAVRRRPADADKEGRPLAEAEACGADRVRRVDPPTGDCATLGSSECATTRRAGTWCANPDREERVTSRG